ncbi:MAG: metallopeptidase TldD-related protein [Candidatus Kapaibacteriales bacterium]
MRKFLILLILILSQSLVSFAKISNAEVLRAMRDELKRQMDSLQLPTLEKPYFIEYTLTFTKSFVARAYLGKLLDSSMSYFAKIDVKVRVGDYSLDNTNFLDFSFLFLSDLDLVGSYQNRPIPIELNYDAIRRELWLATDMAYKQSAQSFSKKVAILKNRLLKDTIPDFSKANPFRFYDTSSVVFKFNFPQFVDNLKKISQVFVDYPNINNSLATFEFIDEIIFYVNSEGNEFIKPYLFTGFEFSATTQSEDGMPLHNFFTAYAPTPNLLPDFDSLMMGTKNLCKTLTLTQSAKPLEESYSGPILFEGPAAGELIAQVLAPNLVAQRALLSEQGLQNFSKFTAFQTKIGGRVLPDFLSIRSIPLQKNYKNISLLGYFFVDDEGIPAQNITLVEKGYLKTLISNRTPIKRLLKSNGNSRGNYPMYSNLEMISDKKHSKSYFELKKSLIQYCKKRDLPFGIIIRKLMNQNILSTVLYKLADIDFKFSTDQPTIVVVEAYKIYPDGKEEIIRGGEIKGFTTQSFKDIILTGDQPYVLNFLAPSLSTSGGTKSFYGASIITPALLFEDGEFKPLEMDFPKPQILKNPLGESSKTD